MESKGVLLPLIHEHLMVPCNDMRKGDCCGRSESITDGFYCKSCDFFAHKKCSESPRYINHPSHSPHALELQRNFPNMHMCNACGRVFKNLVYRCKICDFDLDLYCAKYPPPEVIEVSKTHVHSHKLTLLQLRNKFDCDAKCGKIGENEFSYKCYTCLSIFHLECVWNPLEVKQSLEEDDLLKENTGQAKDESGSTSDMPNVCEVWRLRGNEAYKNGDMRNAEDCYTYGINSSVQPLALCYGNRAAARISLGILREAIIDCEIAALLDPSYIKAHMRVANCYLVLGELESAVRYFNKCIKSASILDRRSAKEGLQQVQKVADYTSCASVFLEKRTADGACDALVSIASALLISSCSDELLQMKAEALFMRRHYNEVIELCENTLQTAQRNFVSAGNVDQLPTVWRWKMISKSHFYLGNLESALDILEKLQQVGSNRNENEEECRDSPSSLMATISELVRYKNAGNEAVRAGKYVEAVEQYTAALSKNVDTRPFAAICFCNRAVANQALNQIADAISDCSLAMALDENYTKAVSRRATLHEMIRDYDQAASDLQRLVDILVKQNNEKTKTPDTSADCATSMEELNEARQRLSLMEKKSKEGLPLDFFLIMGVKASDTAADIKKAYRKAALRHHPDKAAKILVRSESRGPWLKEILEEVHKGADRLFKTIGEAYSELSDPSKRFAYKR